MEVVISKNKTKYIGYGDLQPDNLVVEEKAIIHTEDYGDFTNDWKEKWYIIKVIVDERGNLGSSDAEFRFRIYLIDPEGKEIKDKTKDDADAIWYKSLKDDGSEAADATVINSGGTFTLKAGHSLQLINVPVGMTYKVEEVTDENPQGYEFESVSYTYVDAEHENQTALTPKTKEGFYETSANTWQYVTVKNKQVEISGAELPSTGGAGTKVIYLAGIMLLVAASTGLAMRKRRIR